MKCGEYRAHSELCQSCDIKTNVKCDKKFDFDTPRKFILVKRKDHISTSWNECPTCGNSTGFIPKEKDGKVVAPSALLEGMVVKVKTMADDVITAASNPERPGFTPCLR